ncbi:MAG: hypothetical protein KDJ26_02850 [Alphaproteobacteria bacterium]|jgi:hypothetical protein|nr:hypothetical protein [Alphaproteobacteria bacterium]MCB1550920.1 hypothetical protein [Alphaproteobacteria bacterium]MCB9984343.1 hypothetical protein [Micavibrio sp.]HPQ51518.1 hypothetical protein [Alphaproteobacteria bacterium]HRK97891.1 hypothetical protein [Alphaproteobacteria bacterium]
MEKNKNQAVPNPVEGKHIFQISSSTRIRFNAEGWVEEIGKGGMEDPLGTRLQGKPNSKRDDIFARRYYDLLSRCVILDIHPKMDSDQSGADGLILFKDLEPDSPMFDRVNLIIAIANHHFGMNLKPLK